jgi:hypothetical protein
MCHLFPTEVSCTVKTGGVGGNANKENILCLLPNNVFYQYYFLILWIWWLFLFSLSIVCLIFRLLQFMVPAFSAAVFRSHLSQYNLQFWASDLEYLKLKQWDYFLLIHILNNLKKGSCVTDLLQEMIILGKKGVTGAPESIQTQAI